MVSYYSGETGRRGEDIVMANVHSFDIQVWDDKLAQFVNLNNGGGGDYGGPPSGRVSRGGVYGTTGNRYDTWHPNKNMPAPPYRPVGTQKDSNGQPIDPGLGSVNEIPLRAIRIHIRFYDPGSTQTRDLTFTYSLN